MTNDLAHPPNHITGIGRLLDLPIHLGDQAQLLRVLHILGADENMSDGSELIERLGVAELTPRRLGELEVAR